jgi:hypothetical protein
VVGGKEIVGRSNDEDDAQKNKKTIARAHERTPCEA